MAKDRVIHSKPVWAIKNGLQLLQVEEEVEPAWVFQRKATRIGDLCILLKHTKEGVLIGSGLAVNEVDRDNNLNKPAEEVIVEAINSF